MKLGVAIGYWGLGLSSEDQLAIVQDASRSMLALINELLDLARIEAGRLALEFDTFEIGGLVERRVQPLRALSEPKSLTLDLELPPRPVMITSEKAENQKKSVSPSNGTSMRS